MKKRKIFTVILLMTVLVLCLAGAPAVADEEDFSEIGGVWYTEEVMMTVTDEGRFTIEWFDGDWTGSLEADWRFNEDEEEYAAYVMTLDDPELSMWEKNELVADAYHPGKLTLVQDGTPHEVFWDVPVYVMDMGEEDLEVYEPYAFIDTSDGEEPAVTMMFTFLRPVKDIAVMEMENQQFDEEGNFGYNGVTLEWWPELDSQERIVVKRVFEGDMPDLSIGFMTEDEFRYEFAVTISGADGALELLQIPAGEG